MAISQTNYKPGAAFIFSVGAIASIVLAVFARQIFNNKTSVLTTLAICAAPAGLGGIIATAILCCERKKVGNPVQEIGKKKESAPREAAPLSSPPPSSPAPVQLPPAAATKNHENITKFKAAVNYTGALRDLATVVEENGTRSLDNFLTNSEHWVDVTYGKRKVQESSTRARTGFRVVQHPTITIHTQEGSTPVASHVFVLNTTDQCAHRLAEKLEQNQLIANS